VAKFLGRHNLIRAMRLTSSNDAVTKFKTLEGGQTLIVGATHEELMHLPVNKPCLLAIRPEAISLEKSVDKVAAGDNRLAARIEEVEFGGPTTTLTLDASGLRLEALVLRAGNFNPGDECVVTLRAEQIRLLPEG
jgi:ABC-type Fe3+/spermidine/putrescine transport system ATPase subunit